VEVQKLRESWKPDAVKTLFIGESPPSGGTFFYCGDSSLYRHTKKAFEIAFAARWKTQKDFLSFFRERGCYLVDLCDYPINQITDDHLRRRERAMGIPDLAHRIARVQPTAQIVVMKAIQRQVREATRRSGTRPERVWVLPFPAQSHQRRYVQELAEALNELRCDEVLTT